MDYKELTVWRKAHALTLEVYRQTRGWPKEELYGLTSQVRRAVVSIEANLAEGRSRYGNAEFHRFVQIAAGSAAETECELLIARDLGYLSEEEHQPLAALVDEVRRMLISLASKLTPHASRLTPGAER